MPLMIVDLSSFLRWPYWMRKTAVVLVAMAIWPTTAFAESECSVPDLDKPLLVDWLAKFAAKHTQATLGPERRLANGVAWRTIMDRATSLGAPRITWMPDRVAMTKINLFLEAFQGCLMMAHHFNAFATFELMRERADIPDAFRIRTSNFKGQPAELVELAYASPRFASFFNVIVHWPGETGYPWPLGVTRDVRQGKLIRLFDCNDEAALFRFDYDCNPTMRASFTVLWHEALNPAIAADDRKSQIACSYSPGDDDLENWAFEPYLTLGGLAVFKVFPKVMNFCMLDKSRTNPVIIPYQKLASLMTPGALRDELLSLK